jgi:uncharacterized protein (DUF433 family)
MGDFEDLHPSGSEQRSLGVRKVELIGRTSNLAHMSKRWHDLRERIIESSPRPHPLYQDRPKPRSKRVLNPRDLTDIVARYQAGNTTQQIGTHYGISKTRVATVLREQGATIRRQGLSDEQVRDAARLYAQGASLAQIGTRFDVSHTTVAAALRRQGIKLRPRPGWT